MAKSRKEPPLADWTVAFTGATPPFTLTVRATFLDRDGGDYVLRDTYGHPLFAAPKNQVVYVRRAAPGEKAARPSGEYPPSVPGLEAPPAAPDPGPAAEKAVPAPRGRRTR
jgi:hypothetical protein